jgi:hypothetical protein
MAKPSRRNRPRPTAGPPVNTPRAIPDISAETLAARIRDGHLDAELPALIEAINQRLLILEERRTRQALAQLSIGTRVRINDTVKPRYLQGQHGEVHDIDGEHIVVCLDTPTGRFTSGHIRCSPLALEPINDVET